MIEDRSVRIPNALAEGVSQANLGDAKSLVTHPATTTHRAMGPEGRAAIGLGDGVVRISVRLEDLDDLIADIDQALS